MTNVDLNPQRPTSAAVAAADLAKKGMNRAAFNKWLATEVFPDGVQGVGALPTGAYGNQGPSEGKIGKATAPTKTETDVLWSLYQHYGTIDKSEAFQYVSNLRSKPQFQSDDAHLLSATRSASAAAPDGTTAPPPVTTDAKPDAKGAVAAASKGNPALAAILNNALANGAGSTTVTLWSNLGVDPDAPVFGAVKNTKTTNTMDKSGRLVHGIGDSLGMGIVPTTQTADKWLKGLYTMSPQDLVDLQHRLYDQGWYTGTKVTDPSMIQYGRPDAATLEAYGSVLAEGARYQAAGKHISIDGVIALGGTLNSASGTGQPFERTNPADLNSALRSQAQQQLGHDPSAGDLAAYQDEYLGQEDAARRELIAAGTANRTEGVTGPPSPTAGAEQYIDSHNTADKIAYGSAVRQQAFFDMLKAPV